VKLTRSKDASDETGTATAAYGLAAAGEQGVQRVLELLNDELVTSMALCGRSSIGDVDRSLVEEASPVTTGTKEIDHDDD